MIACRNVCDEIIEFLIDSGANVRLKSLRGETALHLCVNLRCVRLLVEGGADLDEKFDGMTALLIASTFGQASIVEYLTNLGECSLPAAIEALELMGATSVDRENQLKYAVKYWSAALDHRSNADPSDLVQPKSHQPHPVYGNVKEFETFEELNVISRSTARQHKCRRIVRLLLDAGAHYDARNDARKRFTRYLPDGIASSFGNPFDYCNLQCLSARAVLKHQIQFETVVPAQLATFVKLH